MKPMFKIFSLLDVLNGWRTLIFSTISILSTALGLFGLSIPLQGRELYGNLIISMLASGLAFYFRLLASKNLRSENEGES